MMKILIYMVALLWVSCVSAQGNLNYKNFKDNFFPNSPNATPFATYGKYPVNLYKGVPSISIPLFKSQASGYDFDMSLDYNVKSVKPETIPSSAGLGWHLNVGGAITRIVNGGVDEVYQSLNTPDHNRYSYLDHPTTLNTADWSSTSKLENYYQNNVSLIFHDLPGVVPAPDEFIINVSGITGSFYMNEKGNWVGRTREGRTFRVEHFYKNDFVINEVINQIHINENFVVKRVLYGFTITMDDGVKYIFGQNDDTIEFSSTAENLDYFNPQIIASAWNIKEISYPNGKKIKYSYERDKSPVFLNSKVGNASFYSQGNTTNNSAYAGDYHGLITNKVNQVFLKRIEGEDFNINFNRSLANQKEYAAADYIFKDWELKYNVAPNHLNAYANTKHWFKCENIEITDKANHPVHTIRFNFNNDSNDRLFLKSIVINDIEKYAFKYNSQKLPSYLSDAVDGWGFYNGSNFLGSVSLNVGPQQLKNIFQNIYPTHKIPNLNFSKAGTLEEITYPTGGKSYFNYELNTYSKYGEKTMSEQKLKLYNTSNSIAGGLRIQSIKSCDENNKCVSKTYSYLNDDGVTSSGILPFKPLYVIEGGDSSINLNFWEFNMHSYQSLKDEDNSVGYSRVEEIDSNGGRKITYFTNFDQSENNDDIGVNYYGWMKDPLFIQLPYKSASLMRGKPIKEIISTNTKNISETVYKYSQQIDYLRSYTSLYKQFGTVAHNGIFTDLSGISFAGLLEAHLVNFNTSLLSQKITTTDGVSRTENYSYTNLNTPSVVTRMDSSGIFETQFDYAADTNNFNLQSAYMVGIPLVVTEKKNGLTIGKTETNYPGSLPTPQTGNLSVPLSEISHEVGNNSKSFTEISYDAYDSQGNLLQYTTKTGTTVAVVWGYHNTKPIAKIEGATYGDVEPEITDIVAASNADAIQPPHNDESLLLAKLSEFRKKSSLSSFSITTYTYDPLIGVRSMTPPSGITQFYNYDSANKLKDIRDVNGHLIKEFSYHYAPLIHYNSEKSKSFQRNNCGTDYVGGVYNYIVPANKYSSVVSEEDADQLALDEINANGQNAANTNASCEHLCQSSAINSNIIDCESYSVEVYPNNYSFTISFTVLQDTRLIPTVVGNLSSCAPTSEKTATKNIDGVQWTVKLKTTGEVVLSANIKVLAGQSGDINFNYTK